MFASFQTMNDGMRSRCYTAFGCASCGQKKGCNGCIDRTSGNDDPRASPAVELAWIAVSKAPLGPFARESSWQVDPNVVGGYFLVDAIIPLKRNN
jgi:hypothetical protein